MTARKITMTSWKVNISGLKMPRRATSIMPLENVVPARTPSEATIIMVTRDATLEPTAEFRKLTASLATPT